MSASDPKKQRGEDDSGDIVADVRRYLATLPKKDGSA